MVMRINARSLNGVVGWKIISTIIQKRIESNILARSHRLKPYECKVKRFPYIKKRV